MTHAGPAGDTNMKLQMDRLNAAFGGVIIFEKLAVLRYQVADPLDPSFPSPNPACFDNDTPRACSDPGKLNYLNAKTWVKAVVNDDPFDGAVLDLVQQLTLYPGKNSPPLSTSILNVFLWDW
jgi:hypothetical protein